MSCFLCFGAGVVGSTKVIKYEHWFFKLPFMKDYVGMAVTPNLIIFRASKDNVSQRLINHEKIHQSQMIQHGLLIFWFWYIVQYLWGLIRYGNHDKAYRNISYEIKARELEKI